MTKYLCLPLCLVKCEHYLIYTTNVVFNNKEEKNGGNKKKSIRSMSKILVVVEGSKFKERKRTKKLGARKHSYTHNASMKIKLGMPGKIVCKTVCVCVCVCVFAAAVMIVREA